MAILLVAAAGLIYLQGQDARAVSPAEGATAALAAATQAVTAHASNAAAGNADAVERLRAAYGDLQSWRSRVASPPGDRSDWASIDENTSSLIEQADAFVAISEAGDAVAASASALVSGAERLLGVSGATSELQAFQQSAAGLADAVSGLAGADDVAAASEALTARIGYLNEVTDALGGEDTDLDISPLSAANQEEILGPVRDELSSIESAVATAVQRSGELDGAAGNAAEIGRSAQAIYSATLAAASAGREGSAGGSLPSFLSGPTIPFGLVIMAAILIGLLFFLQLRSNVFESTAREQADQNERNQQAILRLLDELGSLADGDLTVEATVTEDITGAIADSINYAIEALRELVATIDQTSIMVDSAAKQTENTATHLARAAEKQTREINAATESIVSMAASIEEVSGNAERSSDVARHSVDVAHKGGEAVRRTIDGMNTIRETIQDTSKRIKRLGESSQEIGNIVELINDIAEQTNILALNASIQASMAGEAGRGFAVVADEVQRLAERSTNATKQIEVLVRTIQADTNEAVVSMERSTTDVVGGALLAENAGAALDEIEQVSNQIASLVQNISGSARQQASSAADVTRRTSKLKEISEQTGKATSATAASISKLSHLASQLRQTVSGFTIPGAELGSSPLAAAAPQGQAAAAPAQPPNKPKAVPPTREKAAGQG